MTTAIDDAKRVEPDPLLMCFATALWKKPIVPFALKDLLENAGCAERGKATNQETALALAQIGAEFEQSIIQPAGPRHDVTECEKSASSALLPERLDHAYRSLASLLQMPMVEKNFFKLVVNEKAETVTAMEAGTARQIIASLAMSRLAELSDPDLPRTYLAAAAETRKSLIEGLPRPPHRPSSSKNALRYRTAAVAAAEALRKWQGKKPGEARAWVAARLNRAGLIHHRGKLSTPKTIENWSSKMHFDPGLITCLEVIADCGASEGLPMKRAAEAAIFCAIKFGKLMEKTP